MVDGDEYEDAIRGIEQGPLTSRERSVLPLTRRGHLGRGGVARRVVTVGGAARWVKSCVVNRLDLSRIVILLKSW